MTAERSYWSQTRVARRTVLRGTAVAGAGLVLSGVVGCAARGSQQASRQTGTATALDSTKGKPGGKFMMQGSAYPGVLVLVKTNNAAAAQHASFTHSGLLEFRNGVPGVDGTDISVQPDLAQAMPEQTDPLTYTYKLREARFHNGRAMTADDVKYSFERYALATDSAYKSTWTWLDKVETPDPRTVVVKTKAPYADALQSMAARNDAFILAREHAESADAEKKLMGSGAFLFVETQQPVLTRFRKNPDYFNKPYPYFDEVTVLGTTDFPKKVADFSSRQVHMTYWHGEEDRAQIRQARPDAVEFRYPAPTHVVTLRADQPPLNDKRVRQALSMSINRKAIRDAVTKGAGEDDQFMSISAKYWGFRKPAELGAAAKYWTYDPQAAKQLLAAAGVTQPIVTDFVHWEASHIGQGLVDAATLIQSNWKALGIADVRDVSVTFAQSTTTYAIGNYNGMVLAPNGTPINPAIGIALRSVFFAPPEGVKVPTLNIGHVNDPTLNALLDKQLGQLNREERRQTFKETEDVLAEEQYRLGLSTYFYNYYGDPSVKNMQTPREAYNGGVPYVKYWWFA
jgi:glutathione transport system substrate-binding protein